MNLDRIVHGRLTINDEKISLGRASFATMLLRIGEQYDKKKYDGNQLRVIIEIGDKPMSETLMSRDEQIAQEFASLPIADAGEEIFPGVTVAEAMAAMDTEVYQNYEHICEPANRMGMPDSHIQTIKSAFELNYPKLVGHSPIWR